MSLMGLVTRFVFAVWDCDPHGFGQRVTRCGAVARIVQK
jgi:hypothetical protein